MACILKEWHLPFLYFGNIYITRQLAQKRKSPCLILAHQRESNTRLLARMLPQHTKVWQGQSQKHPSSSLLRPIHPAWPRAQNGNNTAVCCLTQGSISKQTLASLLIKDKMLNALKMKSGWHLGAKPRNTILRIAAQSFTHLEFVGVWVMPLKSCHPYPGLFNSLLPTSALTQLWFRTLQFGKSLSAL